MPIYDLGKVVGPQGPAYTLTDSDRNSIADQVKESLTSEELGAAHKTLVWENDSIDSDFSSRTIYLKDQFDSVEIVYMIQSTPFRYLSSGYTVPLKWPITSEPSTYVSHIGLLVGGEVVRRDITVSGANQLRFGSTVGKEAYMKPYRIYGLKEITGEVNA